MRPTLARDSIVAAILVGLGWAGLAGRDNLSRFVVGVPDANAGTTARACDQRGLRVNTSGWRTDFARCSVPLSDFRGGGPGRDGIPPLDRPTFESVADAGQWLRAREPVIQLEINGDARAYPLQILIWHEIVNDRVGSTPVAVTFCPLCNTAIAFDRRVDGQTLDFGTTGNLRHSDLVMWDRQTETWWQQAGGDAIVGEMSGVRLTMVPASIVSWETFRTQRPNGRVLSRETGYRRDYGSNPYVGYDDVSQSPFLLEGRPDGRLRPMERVVSVAVGGEAVAYAFSDLRSRGVIMDRIGGLPVAVLFQQGTASALDARSIADSRDVGAAAVYVARAADGDLTLAPDGDGFSDLETGTRWTLLGEASAGPLAGTRLEPLAHVDAFWFATAAFYPEVRIWSP